jgi:hypothetical protein
MKWTQAQAVELCRAIEIICPKYGCHVALTGGTLYHFGERKDADILFYRIRHVYEIDVDGLMDGLRDLGIVPGDDYGWCYKATYEGRAIDFFFPERTGVTAPGYEEPASLINNKKIDEPEITF